MQVRVHRDQTVHHVGQEAANDGLADDLAWVKGDVLAHVGQVRGHQQDPLGTQAAGFTAHQQQFNQFVIGAVEAAVDHQLRWHAPFGVDR